MHQEMPAPIVAAFLLDFEPANWPGPLLTQQAWVCTPPHGAKLSPVRLQAARGMEPSHHALLCTTPPPALPPQTASRQGLVMPVLLAQLGAAVTGVHWA